MTEITAAVKVPDGMYCYMCRFLSMFPWNEHCHCILFNHEKLEYTYSGKKIKILKCPQCLAACEAERVNE